jgi:hypothetical protein
MTDAELKARRAALQIEIAGIDSQLDANYRAGLAARAEAGKDDPTSGFYQGFARDPWGYPLDPLMND